MRQTQSQSPRRLIIIIVILLLILRRFVVNKLWTSKNNFTLVPAGYLSSMEPRSNSTVPSAGHETSGRGVRKTR